jgi:hypothetical protein
VALLCVDGHGGFADWRLCHVPPCAQRGKGSARRVEKVYKVFGRWGFCAIAIPALLPPPVPMVPFLFAAGAMQYPAGKFLAALTLGRTSRYMMLAFLAGPLWAANHRAHQGTRAPYRCGKYHAAGCDCFRHVLPLGRTSPSREVASAGDR